MQLTRWQPSSMPLWQPLSTVWQEVNRLQEEMDRVFESFGFNGNRSPSFAATYPTLNLWEDEGNLYVEAELPGVTFEDVEIYVTGGDQLTIKGERKQPSLENAVWHRQERGFGHFTRTVTLPIPVEADKVEAHLHNGVLTVRLPKAEVAKPRKITVKSA